MADDNKHNGANGHNNGNGEDKDNVIRIPTLAERDRMRKEKTRQETFQTTAIETAPQKERLFNAPPITLALVTSFIVIHISTEFLIGRELHHLIISNLAFFSGSYTGEYPWGLQGILGPITHMWLHGSFVHLGLNSIMLLTFGTGVERWLGGRRFLALFILCGMFGALCHFIFFPYSVIPVIGASGGISGLFAAILVMMQRSGMAGQNGKNSLLPFIIIWIVISVGFGFIGGPGGSSVAWAAHIGGFLGGFLVLSPMLKKRH